MDGNDGEKSIKELNTELGKAYRDEEVYSSQTARSK